MVINELKEKLGGYVRKLKGVKGEPAGLAVEEPKDKKFGDLSTNAAMVMAPVLKKNPMEIAEKIKADVISGWDQVEDISIVKPGFINFNLKQDFIKKSLAAVIKEDEKFGFNGSGRGKSIQLEYVSSNPTGDLHVGHGRWGAMGDSLANLYMANGYKVSREYYVNDYGSQADKFSECARCIYLKHFNRNVKYPQDGYPDEIVSLAVSKLVDKYGDKFIEKEGDRIDVKMGPFAEEIIKVMVSFIKETLALIGVEYDRWFYESSLYKDSNFEKLLAYLKKKDAVYTKDGALWFRASKYADDKDRVLVRKNGKPTYFASDILYMKDKIKRGYDKLFYILGADHHGYVERLMAIGRAFGLKGDRILVIIGQLVKLTDRGRTLKMSKRKGMLYHLRDLIEDVGKDAVRYFFSMNSFDTPMEFDLDLAKQKSNRNPVYYVQYAHARIESIIKNLREVNPGNLDIDKFKLNMVDTSKLEFKNEYERNLAKTIILYSDMVYGSCRNNAPHLVTWYLYRLASEFHYFYNNYRVIDGEKDSAVVDIDRLVLILLVRRVLQNALKLLNVSAPEKM